MKKITALILIVFLFLPSFGCAYFKQEEAPAVQKDEFPEWASAEPMAHYGEPEGRYSYELLDDGGKVFYKAFLADVFGFKTEKVYVKAGFTSNLFSTIIDAVITDYPEIFWFDSASHSLIKGDPVADEMVYSYTLTFNDTRENVQQTLLSAKQKADELLATVSPSLADYETLCVLYDYVTAAAVYSDEAANVVTQKGEPTPLYLACSSFYGALLNGNAICGGYSKTLQYLLTEAKIPCTFITGKIAADDTPHAWNAVKLDGEWYYVDATWDDATFSKAEEGKNYTTYSYFCITTADLLNTHIITSENPPECTATAYNYFVVNNQLYDKYSQRYVARAFIKSIKAKKNAACLRFANAEAYNEAVEKLFGEADEARIAMNTADTACDTSYSEGTFYYNKNDKLFIITIYY